MIDLHSRLAPKLAPLIQHPWRTTPLATAVLIVGLIIALVSVVPFSSETARRKVAARVAPRSLTSYPYTACRSRCDYICLRHTPA
jgi:hypothetical protein